MHTNNILCTADARYAILNAEDNYLDKENYVGLFTLYPYSAYTRVYPGALVCQIKPFSLNYSPTITWTTEFNRSWYTAYSSIDLTFVSFLLTEILCAIRLREVTSIVKYNHVTDCMEAVFRSDFIYESKKYV